MLHPQPYNGEQPADKESRNQSNETVVAIEIIALHTETVFSTSSHRCIHHIGDYAKDEVDALNAAEVAFQTRNDTFTTWIHLWVIEMQLTNLVPATSHQLNHPKKAEAKQQPAGAIGYRNAELLTLKRESEELSEIASLSEKLPPPVKDRTTTQSNALYKDFDAQWNRLTNPAQDDNDPEDHLGQLCARVSDLTGQAYPEFEKRKHSVENLNVRVRYLSYLFILCGWMMAFVGHLKRKERHADAGHDTSTE